MQSLRHLSRLLVEDAAGSLSGELLEQRELWELAGRHSVHLLLAWRIAEDASERWHPETRAAARDALAHAMALEEFQRRELVRLTAAFADLALPGLLLKGAAWAYNLYPQPSMRPRGDTDVLVERSTRDRAERLLLGLGYEPAVENVMELASAQRHYHRVDGQHVAHAVDLHWRVTNPLVFADSLPFDRLWERSVAVPVLGARTLCAMDGLLLACLHRIAHHGSDSELLWLMDVHLLAAGLSDDEWDGLTREAESNGLRGVCAQSLHQAAECFGTPVPGEIGAWLAPARVTLDPIFLGKGVSPLGALRSDWRAVGTWSGRLSLLREHICPPRSYMVARYGPCHPLLLPCAYGRRAIGGLGRWVMRSGDRR